MHGHKDARDQRRPENSVEKRFENVKKENGDNDEQNDKTDILEIGSWFIVHISNVTPNSKDWESDYIKTDD